MQFQCPDCQTSLTVTGTGPPKFCSNCGCNLSTITATGTAVQGYGETMTIQPRSDSARPIVIESAPTPPREIGPFIIGEQLGQGGMGVVYSAKHQETGRMVAVKILPGHIFSEELIERFKREGQIAASISHPRSTFIYEAGEHDGQLYIAMELMGGGTLKDVVRDEGALSINRGVDFILDMIDGLLAAHRVGVIHRDLKPSNCFIDEEGRVKIGDYGLSKSVLSDNAGLTQTGAFMGTPQFAAPEQIKCSELDERTDIYAIGCTLFYLLTGQPPFAGNAAQVIASIASDRAPRLISLNKDIPKALDRVVAQTLEKDPGKRPENLMELREALLPFSSSGASMANLGRRLAAFFVDIAVAGVIANTLGTMATLVVMFGPIPMEESNRFLYSQLTTAAFQSIGLILYFTVLESRYGKTLGKWLMGLRVIQNSLEQPTFFQALVRSMTLPGLTWVVAALPPIIWSQISDIQIDDGVFQFFIRSQVFSIVSWIPLVVCLVSMRASNGLRGLHELISGTRTVELSGAIVEKRLDRIPISVASEIEEVQLGRFSILGQLGKSGTGHVKFGRDTQLERNVWVFSNCELFPGRVDAEIKAREELSRPTRLRMLHLESGEDEVVVFEAIRGAPLLDTLEHRRKIQWKRVRGLLSDLASELTQSVENGGLPKVLLPEQVWVTESGEMKLLDFPIRTNESTESSEEPEASPEERAVELLRLVFSRLIHQTVLPGHIVDFYRELQEKEDSVETLHWACKTLRDSSDLPSKWSWDDRAAVMASTMGIELVILFSLSTACGILLMCFKDSVLGAGITMGVAAATIYGLAIWSGYHFRGGPVFRLSGIEVRTRDRKLASKSICAVRSAISWLPFAIICLVMLAQIQLGLNPTLGAPSLALSAALVLTALLASGVILVGAVFALFNPMRGIQDFLTGTVLVRK